MTDFVPVPAHRAARYRRAGYWTDEALDAAILQSARAQDPGRAALVGSGAVITFGELPGRVARLAGGLQSAGFSPGEAVVLHLPNSPEFVLVLLALWRAGLVPVMALPAHGEHELGHILDTSSAAGIMAPARLHRQDHLARLRRLRSARPFLRTIVVTGAAARPLEAGEHALVDLASGQPGDREPARPRDPGLLLMSGGTTALPKLIARTHTDYLYNLRVSGEICRVGRETVYLAVLPVAHNFALGCPGVLGTLFAGGTAVFLPQTHAAPVLSAITEHRVTMTAAVPSLALRWAEAAPFHRGSLASMRLLQVGGARLLPEAARRVRAAFPFRLQQVYGMAEGLLNFTREDDSEDVVMETQGRPASADDEIRIVDSRGRPVPEGEVGELWARGPYTIAGYFRAPDHNAVAFTPDGFFRTGDMVRRHLSGNLIVEGRLKDVINRAGEKVAAAELENLLLVHPAVAQVAVVSMPDGALGEAICVFLVTRDGHSLSLGETREYLAARGVARFKLPDRVETLAELPLTSVGKVDKGHLRELAES